MRRQEPSNVYSYGFGGIPRERAGPRRFFSIFFYFGEMSAPRYDIIASKDPEKPGRSHI